jgi:hypothetical protein
MKAADWTGRVSPQDSLKEERLAVFKKFVIEPLRQSFELLRQSS